MHLGLGQRLWAAAAIAVIAGGTLSVRTQGVVPPILLVVNSAAANPYGPYLGEILRAEGLNSFAVAELSALTASQLANVPLVVLAETPLTSSQATLLVDYLGGGGRLVAMRPDAQLAPALGIVPRSSTTDDGYVAIDVTTATGAGFTATTLPFRGRAQNNSLATGATALATLYRDRTTATSFPAVAKYGSTVTWTYDLARSVVYARQGNPANAGVDRDGLPPLRSNDVFYNAIDLDRVSVPHADVQMRWLSRVIADLLADVMPMPRLWYFPNGARTLLIPASDAHVTTQSTYQEVISSLEARGARASLYISRYISLPSTLIAAWRANGHEVGIHPFGYADGVTLDAGYTTGVNWFSSRGWGAPSPTVRTHQVEWQGWVDAAKVAAKYGMRMDLSFYTWGPAVIYADGRQAHGYITGSGLPMRFVDQAGALVPVYQQATSLIDEQLIVGPYSEALSTAAALSVSRKLIDDSQAGGYSAIAAQWHVDYYTFGDVQSWIESTMDYANSNGVPIRTAQRWLNFTTSRAATTMTNQSWSPAARQLSFTVAVPSSSEPQSLALSAAFEGFGLTGVTVDGTTATGVKQQITERATMFFSIAPGSHNVVATYDTPLPSASLDVSPTTINQGQAATLSWATTNATSVTIDQGIGTVAANGSIAVSPTATTTYRLTATNTAGSATATATLTVVPPPPTATLAITPTTITQGNPATLSWSTTNAATITIEPGIGAVGATGTRAVSPPATTTYTLTAANMTGSATATATLTVNPAPPGSSLSFNGSNQRARFTTLPALTVLTVEGWVKRTADTGRYETFFSNADTGYGQQTVGMYVDGGSVDCGGNPSDQFAWAYTRTTGSWFFQCSGVTANLNTWHHIAVTRDSANVARIFIDGVLKSTSTNTPAPTTSSGFFGIGAAGDAATEYFPGLLDEIRISSVSRYTGSFTPQSTIFGTDPDTVALYHLNEGTGQTLADASGNNRNGFLGTSSSPESIDPVWSTDVPFTGPPLPTVTFSVSPTTMTSGNSAMLTWTTTNATGATIDQGIGTIPLSGSRVVSPPTTTTYTLTATNANGSTTATATLTVTPPPPTATLSVSPTSINLGQSATLSWTTTNATSVTIDQGIGTVAANGSVAVSPTATTTYQLTATNSGGSATSTATLTVVGPPPPPPTATLTVSPTTITAGNPATLSWSTTNAATITIDQGIGAVGATGTRTVSPAATTMYTLTATNVSGSATATATLTVNPAPPGSSLQFNGSTQRARFTTLPAMTVLTVEAWVKRTADTGRYETFVSNAASGYSQETFGLYVDGGNVDCGSSPPDQFAWAYTRVGGGWFFQCSGVTADLNGWHHIAVTRDSANVARIFIDGVLRATATGTPAPTASTGAFGVGEAADAETEYFSGFLDEVRISNIPRYSSSFAPQSANFAPDANTIALYHFDEGTGQTLSDSSGNNRHGVLGTSSAVEAADALWSTDAPIS